MFTDEQIKERIENINTNLDNIIYLKIPFLKLNESLNKSLLFQTKLVLTKKPEKLEDENEFIKQSIKITKENVPLVLKSIPTNFLTEKERENNINFYKETKEKFCDLRRSPNVLPTCGIITEIPGHILILRQYITNTLKDILYNEPFLSFSEKLFIFIQILHGLKQLEEQDLCHGDLKPENILISSRMSVFLSDMSVYKPAYIKFKDLQFYQYLFVHSNCDSVENMACYLAPERFLREDIITPPNKSAFTPEMDIFSVGAVMLEFFRNEEIFNRSVIYNKNEFTHVIGENLRLLKLKDDESTGGCYANLSMLLNNMLKYEPEKRINLSMCMQFLENKLLSFTINNFLLHLNSLLITSDIYQNDLFIAFCFRHFPQIFCMFYAQKTAKGNENQRETRLFLGKLPTLRNMPNLLILDKLFKVKPIYDIKLKKELIFLKPKVRKNSDKNSKEEYDLDLMHEELKEESLDDLLKNNCVRNDNSVVILIRNLMKSILNVEFKSSVFVGLEIIESLSQILIYDSPENESLIVELILPYVISLFKDKSMLNKSNKNNGDNECSNSNNNSYNDSYYNNNQQNIDKNERDDNTYTQTYDDNSEIQIRAFNSLINLLSLINYNIFNI